MMPVLKNAISRHLPTLAGGSAAIAGLLVLSRYHFLLFHTLAEIFSIVIAGTIFVLTWNSRRFLDNGYLLVFGTAYLFIGGIDLLHTLAYQGMNIVPGSLASNPNAANMATQFWVAGRYVQGLTLVLAPLFLRRKPNDLLLMVGYAAFSGLLVLAIITHHFPEAFITGATPPLTPFKVLSEYGVILLYGIGIALLVRLRASFDPEILWMLVASVAFSIASEVAFTGYQSVSGMTNAIGHALKIIAFYLAYKAIIEMGFLKPQQFLFNALAQREAALRASETRERARAAQLEAIMDVVPAVVWIAHDAQARDVSGNQASADLLGLPAKANHSRYAPEVAGRFKFLDKEGSELPSEGLALHRSAATGQPARDVQETLVSPDGSARHLYGNVAPLLDEAGLPVGAVAAFLDMTGRIQAERALAESERRYRTLFETMAEAFALQEVLFDDAGQPYDYRILECNPAYEKMLRHTRDELVGHTIRELMPEPVSPWIAHYAQVLQTGKPVRFEDYSHLAGRYFEALVNPISATVCASMAIDVTDRHLSQEALRQSEARLRRLVESNIIGILYSDNAGKITLANGAFLAIAGYSRADFERGEVDMDHLTPPEYAALDARGRAEASATGACTPYEKELLRIDGTRVPVLIGYAYLAGDDPLYLAFILDLTGQKRAEASAHEAAARLERSNVEISKANRELARANQELQDFAFVASHDLQEPLRKIQAFGERLKAREGGQLDGESKDYLARMLNATQRMRTMIDDLLELSRVTTRGLPFEQVDLNEVAREVISDLELRLERTHGRVIVGNLPSLEADRLQMHQLLLNLISNALKFHQPEISPIVNLIGECTSGDQKIIIRVKDNGIGFDDRYVERIFQPFQRLNGMGQFEGSGIGLSICRKIIERHSGTISAESTPGQGSTFIVNLPARQPKRSN